MTITDKEADHLLGQMLEDLVTHYDDASRRWLSFWSDMPADDKLVIAQRGAPRVLDLAAALGISAGHRAFPRVGAFYAALTYESRLSDT